MFMKWRWPSRWAISVSWTALADGQMVAAGNIRLEVLHTPGHAPDHICLWRAGWRRLFGGDLLIEGGSVVVPGTRGGGLIAYLDSLRRVAALNHDAVARTWW